MPRTTAASPVNLTIEIAEKLFDWREVREHDGKRVGQRQDKLGRWRTAEVPDYANDPIQAIFVEFRMRQLGRWERYQKELVRQTTASKLADSRAATPEQRCKAALKALRRSASLGVG